MYKYSSTSHDALPHSIKVVVLLACQMFELLPYVNKLKYCAAY